MHHVAVRERCRDESDLVAGRASEDLSRAEVHAVRGERVRDRMDRLAELDLVSQDVLIDVVRTLEQQQWMLRAQLSDHV